MIIGLSRPVVEATIVAASAPPRRPYSPTMNGLSRTSASRNDGASAVAWLRAYGFVVLGASLRLINLNVLRTRFEKIGVSAGSQNLAFHQKHNLVVVFNGSDLLRHRKKSNARVVPPHVFQDSYFSRCVDARGEIVEEQHTRIEREST